MRMGTINELAKKLDLIVIPADATNTEDLESLVEQSTEKLGEVRLYFTFHRNVS